MKTYLLKAQCGRVSILKIMPHACKKGEWLSGYPDFEGDQEKLDAAILEKAVKDFASTRNDPNASSFLPVEVYEIDPTTIPTDRTNRDAWTHDGKSFGLDPSKMKAPKAPA